MGADIRTGHEFGGVEDQHARHGMRGTAIALPPWFLALVRGGAEDLPCGQAQLATSGRSSPCSLVQAQCLVRVSVICCRSHAAVRFSPGTRSMTSITRWNRSMLFMTTMSNGVVVVPSSMYPRTWMLACPDRR